MVLSELSLLVMSNSLFFIPTNIAIKGISILLFISQKSPGIVFFFPLIP